MKKIDMGDLSPYYKTDDAMLFLGDSFSVLEKLEPESVDMVFAENKFCYVVLPRRKHVDEVVKELAKKHNLKVESIEKA